MTAKQLLVLFFASATIIGLTGTSHAQYMYLDSNGDGVWTAADRINPNGTPTTVAAWVNTNHNRNGSLATCDTGDGNLGFWNSYAANLRASGGTATFGTPTNNQPTFTISSTPFQSSTTEMTFGMATGTSEAAGLERMFTLTITALSGSPTIGFIPYSTLGPDPTSFGTPCSGNDFDNTYKLGSDWLDADGLFAAILVETPPVITAPATASGSEGSPIAVTATATDADAGQLLMLCQTNNAPFFPASSCAGPLSNPSLTVTGTPNFSQSGTYTITWTATESASPALTTTAFTSVFIANLNRNPVIIAPATGSFVSGVLVSVTGSASDPDGQLVTLSQTNNATFLTGPASAGPSLNPSITLSGTPTVQCGTYLINWVATDTNTPTAGTATATTALSANCPHRAPVITAPTTVSGAEGAAVSVTASATDPDAGQLVTLSQINNAPFIVGPPSAGPFLNTSITLSGTPSFTQSGTYTINWSATDNSSPPATSSATTTLSIANTNRNPVIVAPATVSGTEGMAVSITGSASDPDGQNVTLTQTTTAPFLAGPASAGPSLTPSITLTGTPSLTQSGTYTINWSATDNSSPPATSSATTTLSIANTNRNPVIVAPATVSGPEGVPVSITGSAVDPDGQNVTLSQTNNAPFLTGPASAGPSLNPSITLIGTPGFTSGGAYTINWTAVDANIPSGTSAATTTLVIGGPNRAPVILAPASVTGQAGVPLSVTASAGDPDGQNVTLCVTANGFIIVIPCAGPSLNPSLTVTATLPVGSYSLTWSATDSGTPAGSAIAITVITIVPKENPAPVISAPATVSGLEGNPVTVTASAIDAEGQNVTLSQTNNAPFLTGPASAGPSPNPSITLTGIPSYTQSGSYTITWTAFDSNLSSTAITNIFIANVNPGGIEVTSPAEQTISEGQLLTFTVFASDPDGDHVTLSAPSKPLGSTFIDNGNNTGTFSWTPDFGAGTMTYTVTFFGSDGRGGTGTATTTIHVLDVQRPPVADAGGPYSGVIGVAVTFDGSGTSDPDGGSLGYAWDFGDGSALGSGVTTSHTYLTVGTFPVTLTVTDPTMLSDTDATTARIDSFYTASAFTTGGNGTISLSAGKPYACIQVEPTSGSFATADVILSSIRMVSPGTGSVSEIGADATKTTLEGDKNRNGITEITACFKKEDLRLLFSLLPSGRNPVRVAITGTLVTGGTFRTTIDLVVKSTGGALALSISPNPMNPRAKVSFRTLKPGALRVQMFDAKGRLVKTIAEEQTAEAGYHDFAIDGTGSGGSRVASGVYFVKVWTQHDGEEVGAITLLK